MFNLFKKKNEEIQEEEQVEKEEQAVSAQLIYFVDEDEPRVDVSIPDYSKESIQNLTILLAGISGSVYFNPTLELVKEGMIEEGEEEALIKLLGILQVLHETKERIDTKDSEEQPCIKPQDAL
tara:strand:+ start:1753 stop:2121 length:369 start_codon:yes stop_codon:yes gene_type:complete